MHVCVCACAAFRVGELVLIFIFLISFTLLAVSSQWVERILLDWFSFWKIRKDYSWHENLLKNFIFSAFLRT